MKILFLVPYPIGQSPSQRFRFEQYFELLEKKGGSYHVQPFLNLENWKLFFKSGHVLKKVLALFNGFLKRFFILFSIPNYDFIFVHRELTSIGPPFFEWLIAKVLQKKIIYDFDDAIWLTDRPNESGWLQLLKWRIKVRSICKWSYKISCGNEFLVSYAKQFNDLVIYNPTTIDTEKLHVSGSTNKKESSIVIGWTGSHSTIKYLDALEPVFQQIEQIFSNIQFVFIADKPVQLHLKSLIFIPWNLENEISDLSQIDIGIMPLPDDVWSKGKCGFKALQYMALEIPVVASPVGVNPKIIEHDSEGFLASTKDEWIQCLTQLITHEQQRKTMGQNGRRKVIKSYSVISNTQNFLDLFV